MTTAALEPAVRSHGTPGQRIRRWLGHNALFVYTFAAIVYLMLPIVVVVLRREVIEYEERYLTAKFGEPYRAYVSRVRRWL